MLASWLSVLAPALSGQSEPANVLREGTIFAGHYHCGSPAWLLLYIEEVKATSFSAVFHFLYPTSSQHGAFAMSGTISEATEETQSILRLKPGNWVHKAPGKVMPVGLTGVISLGGSRIKGEVMHLGCGGFDVNRTQLDFGVGTLTLGADGTAPRALNLMLTEDGVIADEQPSRAKLQLMINGLGQLVGEAQQVRGSSAKGGGSDGGGGGRGSQGAEAGAHAVGGLTVFDIAEVGETEVQEETSAAQRILRRQLTQRLQERRWLEAYATWRQLTPRTQQVASHSLTAGVWRVT